MMAVLKRTDGVRLKLRSAAIRLIGAAVLSGLCALGAPAAAQAKVAVTGYAVSSAVAPAAPGVGSFSEPALVPAPNGSDAEWLVVSGRNQQVVSITPTGQQQTIASGMATGVNGPLLYASVAADGYDWILDNDQGPGNVLYAVGAPDSQSPGLNPVARLGDYGQDLTLGPDGALYAADNTGLIRCQISAAPAASCSTTPLPLPFYTGAGAFALGAGGGQVWFTDGLGELGSYGPAGFGGPYPAAGVAAASTDPGTIVTAGNGMLYAAASSSPGSGVNDELVELDPQAPDGLRVAASDLGNVVAMTVGPDGNVWFLDAGDGGLVGELNVATGDVFRFALPAGFALPASGWRIAPGPSVPGPTGDGEVFFTATTSNGGEPQAAVGEVTGIPFPLSAGALAFASKVTVSRRHVAVLTFACSGPSTAACEGRLTLSARARLVPVRARGRLGHGAAGRLRVRVRRLVLGRFGYDLRGGRSLRATVRLSPFAYQALEQLASHRLDATVAGSPRLGTLSGHTIVLEAAAPAAPRRRGPGHRA
jgi:streptogramin lyase